MLHVKQPISSTNKSAKKETNGKHRWKRHLWELLEFYTKNTNINSIYETIAIGIWIFIDIKELLLTLSMIMEL